MKTTNGKSPSPLAMAKKLTPEDLREIFVKLQTAALKYNTIVSMRITHQYRLRPTKAQVIQLEEWLETCRRTYNRMLGERFDWWENNRCAVDKCSLIFCGIAPLKDKPNYYLQQNSLVSLKAKYPDIKLVQSQVLQNVVKRVDLAYERFVAGDSTGKRSGKPRFKGRGRYRSLTFTQMRQTCVSGNKITLPKLGTLKLVLHRPIPDGFKIKTATVNCLADGWYVNLSLEDTAVPTLSKDTKRDSVVGIDMGLKEFLITSEGETVPIPQFARNSEKRRKVLNKALSRKRKKGTQRRRNVGKRLAKHYQKVARQRKDFHYKTAGWLVNKYDLIAHEDLNILGLAKTRMSKSVLDAGWADFLAIVSRKAESAGGITVAVNPYNTTQNCSGCGVVVPKTLADRWHACPHCLLEMDRDWNAAINILNLAVGHSVGKAQRVTEAAAGVVEKPAQSAVIRSESGVCHKMFVAKNSPALD